MSEKYINHSKITKNNMKIFIVILLILSSSICLAQPIKSIPYGDVVYEFTQVKTKDDFIVDTKIKVINKSDGKVLYENMMDEIKKDDEKTGFQYLQEYRLIDLNGDGSDELILNGYVGMSPYFLFGNGYIIDKTKSYLPLYEIQNLNMQAIDSVSMILEIIEKESPAVLGLWNIYHVKYNGELELVPYVTEEFSSMLTYENYENITRNHKEMNPEDDICKNSPLSPTMEEFYSYYWRAVENVFYNAYINNVFYLAEAWFLKHNNCPDKNKILEVILKDSEKRKGQFLSYMKDYYPIRYTK